MLSPKRKGSTMATFYARDLFVKRAATVNTKYQMYTGHKVTLKGRAPSRTDEGIMALAMTQPKLITVGGGDKGTATEIGIVKEVPKVTGQQFCDGVKELREATFRGDTVVMADETAGAATETPDAIKARSENVATGAAKNGAKK
jgi:hypothetical protein